MTREHLEALFALGLVALAILGLFFLISLGITPDCPGEGDMCGQRW